MNKFPDLQKQLKRCKDAIRGYEIIPHFHGLKLSEIKKIFNNWNAIPGYREGETIIEVRREDHTLSFMMVNDICTKAYRFDG